MADQNDFDNLVVRIDTATDTLETTIGDLSGGVQQVQAAATLVEAQKDVAIDAAIAATHARDDAEAARDEVIGAVGYGDAPSNGLTYGRNNKEWVVVEGGGGGGGSGAVNTVNDKAPDAGGNVELEYGDLKSLPTLFDGKYSSLEGTPTLFSGSYNDLSDQPSIIPEAPLNGLQYARKDGAWSEVTASSGGGGGEGFTIRNDLGVLASPVLFESLKRGGTYPWATYNDAVSGVNASYVSASIPLTANPFDVVDVRAYQYKASGGILLWGGNMTSDYDIAESRPYKLLNEVKRFFYTTGTEGRELRLKLPEGRYFIRDIAGGLGMTESELSSSGFARSCIGQDSILEIIEARHRRLTIKFLGKTDTPNSVYDFQFNPDGSGRGSWRLISGVTSFEDLSDKPDIFSGEWDDILNKPAVIDEAPSDGKAYARKNEAWSEVDTSGGGGGGGASYSLHNPMGMKFNPVAFNTQREGGFNKYPWDTPAEAEAAGFNLFSQDASEPINFNPNHYMEISNLQYKDAGGTFIFGGEYKAEYFAGTRQNYGLFEDTTAFFTNNAMGVNLRKSIPEGKYFLNNGMPLASVAAVNAGLEGFPMGARCLLHVERWSPIGYRRMTLFALSTSTQVELQYTYNTTSNKWEQVI